MSATPEQIAAAWASWKVRHKGSIGPGPGFVEAINAALAIPARDENARFRVALEWYADDANWKDGHFIEDEPNSIMLVMSSIDNDQGKTARAALKEPML